MQYTLTAKDGRETIAALLADGGLYVADSTHPNYARIRQALFDGDYDIAPLFDATEAVKQRFEALSERVSVTHDGVYFDGDPVDNALTRLILRFLDSDEDFEPLVNFMEKVYQNPQEHSREQLFSWLRDRDFTITPDGDFIAYKGVSVQNGRYFSINSGSAIVDGETVEGVIPNEIGSVIEMPRSKVAHDPGVGCSYGLHAGTWDYAKDFARGAVLTVVINPRDVVSVPTDCDAQKLRVCRYQVLEATEVEYTEPVYGFADDDFYDDFDPDADVEPYEDVDAGVGYW